jgi:hypothetical protein
MPDVWGEGQLLAFSGLDGATDWAQPFVLATGERPGDLQIRLPAALKLQTVPARDLSFDLVLGDAIQADDGDFIAVFRDHHSMVGRLPDGCTFAAPDGELGPEARILARTAGNASIVGFQRGARWGLLHTDDALPAEDTIRELASLPLENLVRDRAAFVRNVPIPACMPDSDVRLLRKAVSVMKVNTHSPCGTIRRRWSTPDRWPHQHMWLWDSAFHAVGMLDVNESVAQDILLAMIEQVAENGMLPHMIQADGGHSSITQPPILAWAAERIATRTGDMKWVKDCLPCLRQYLDWDRYNRDKNRNGIPEWFIEGSPLCRCGESGLDNSSVYDRAVLLDAPDFGAFLANDTFCLGRLAGMAGDREMAATCEESACATAAAVNDLLWDDSRGFYFHRDFEGRFVPVKAVSGFMPLFAGIPDEARAARLLRHLENPTSFGAPCQVPSESLDSGTFSKDMWRGPAWMNLSYLVLLGLRRYGYAAEAECLKQNMLDTVRTWYEAEGCIFEYYDSLGCTSPRQLDRKQRLISGRGIAPICDYHWTAAVTVALLLE